MACHDTVENKRSAYTKKTLESLRITVDWSRHRLILVDNGSCEETKKILDSLTLHMTLTLPEPTFTKPSVIHLPENIGTARAINLGIRERHPGEHIIKIDNDCVIHQSGWVEEMEEAVQRDPNIGVVGLKRKDLAESPNSDHPFYVSSLRMLSHEPGQRWIVVEDVHHVMGTCQMIVSSLLEKAGYYYQKSLYGLDDSDMSYRSELLGFRNCFLPHINIDHIDVGGDVYTNWKHQESEKVMHDYGVMCQEYRDGKRSLYYDGGSSE